MKDKELKLEEVKDPHTLGGASYILSIYINSAKTVVRHLSPDQLALFVRSEKSWRVMVHISWYTGKNLSFCFVQNNGTKQWKLLITKIAEL